jgi:hypothetical protein
MEAHTPEKVSERKFLQHRLRGIGSRQESRRRRDMHLLVSRFRGDINEHGLGDRVPAGQKSNISRRSSLRTR